MPGRQSEVELVAMDVAAQSDRKPDELVPNFQPWLTQIDILSVIPRREVGLNPDGPSVLNRLALSSGQRPTCRVHGRSVLQAEERASPARP